MSDTENTALKEIFNERRFRDMALDVKAVYPLFDTRRFLKISLAGLDDLTLMQRLRRMTQALHATLPADYRQALEVLRALAQRIEKGFATLVPPDYVGQYGLDDFDVSMDALKFFTVLGSSEFAVREFLRKDLKRALAIMKVWSRDDSEDVRRLASEGSRPRLPWSFRLDAILADPSLAAPILENLRSDPSLYVRKSVANHLNDVTKSHPEWVLDRLATWPIEKAHTAWIAKRALRSLIKAGNGRALAVIGAGGVPDVKLSKFAVTPRQVALGERVTLSFDLASRCPESQRLVIDYRMHYVKKSGVTAAKVFKLKELTLDGGQKVAIERTQNIRDFTTRIHYAGRHDVEILVNGVCLAKGYFDLSC
ncbi:DNA alkylation repair protein [Caballeronia sordidicola]|uniref:DNA alkylation repair protein n=1 Tax=Caballeronia sordidicola TaxID=196367 RepID=UPI0004D017C8|nr:DNA alkylation repair protein [Caballeronia sordidicola]